LRVEVADIENNKMKIGFVGLSIMGKPMALHLLKAGQQGKL
jgi:3-hydroxyisobutyrate dehydrogenase-like beta-hydroxyacid dehydrogenase